MTSGWIRWLREREGGRRLLFATNRFQGVRAVGGSLRRTDTNLRFLPNRFEHRSGGKPQEVETRLVVSVTPSWLLRYAVLRTSDGRSTTLLVPDIGELRAELGL